MVEDIVDDYRRTFLESEHGKRCFKHLLSFLCLYRDITDEEERVKHNAALAILSFCGMWGGPGLGIEDDFVDRMKVVDITERIDLTGEENERSEPS